MNPQIPYSQPPYSQPTGDDAAATDAAPQHGDTAAQAAAAVPQGADSMPQPGLVQRAAELSATRRQLMGWVGAAGALAAGMSLSGCGETQKRDATIAEFVPVVAAANVPVAGAVEATTESGVSVLITQPTAGTFHAYDARCPHQGCLVKVQESQDLVCPCHQSVFAPKDGSPLAGPAREKLLALDARVVKGMVEVRTQTGS